MIQSLINFGEENETTPLRDMHFIEEAARYGRRVQARMKQSSLEVKARQEIFGNSAHDFSVIIDISHIERSFPQLLTQS
jgi:hypothetical protein